MDGFFFDFADDDGDSFFEDGEDVFPSDDAKAGNNLVPDGERIEDEFRRFSPYERYPDEIDADDTISQIDHDMRTAATAAAIASAVVSTESNKKREVVETEQVVEYVSLQDASKEQKVLEQRKLPKRPFEKWVEDVIHGKKTLDDPL